MAAKPPRDTRTAAQGATTGYEAGLWRMADSLRGLMDAAEYKHVVLGLIFLKYISDAFEERHAAVLAEWGEDAAEDRDEYIAENIFWVPAEARWTHLEDMARQPAIGRIVDGAMAAIEHDNPVLREVLPKDYARPALDRQRLGQLIDLISNIRVGDEDARSRDVLGRVLRVFPLAVRQRRGQEGRRVLHPALRRQSAGRDAGAVPRPGLRPVLRLLRHVRAVGGIHPRPCQRQRQWGSRAATSPSTARNRTTRPGGWRKMNLAIRCIEGQIAHGDSFHNDHHPDLKADFILANPPFNVSDWGGERLTGDKRWQYGTPPRGNANFAWVQHIVHHLAPTGAAGFVLANGSMSSGQSGEGDIRRSLIEAELVDCMVALPGQLFYSTQIPACLWFLARRRQRRGEVLFIDARNLGQMVDRTHRELGDDDIARIAGACHAWRTGSGDYADVPGFCKSASLDAVRRHGHVLTPGRYVGAAPQADDGEPFEAKMARLVADLRAQQAEARRLDAAIAANLERLGFPAGREDTR